jgi:hypothetical protein
MRARQHDDDCEQVTSRNCYSFGRRTEKRRYLRRITKSDHGASMRTREAASVRVAYYHAVGAVTPHQPVWARTKWPGLCDRTATEMHASAANTTRTTVVRARSSTFTAPFRHRTRMATVAGAARARSSRGPSRPVGHKDPAGPSRRPTCDTARRGAAPIVGRRQIHAILLPSVVGSGGKRTHGGVRNARSRRTHIVEFRHAHPPPRVNRATREWLSKGGRCDARRMLATSVHKDTEQYGPNCP